MALETTQSRAIRLLTGPDPTPFLHLISDLFHPDNSLRSDTDYLYNYCIKDYPNTLSLKLTKLLLKSPVPATRNRCATLLRRLLPRIWPNLSLMSKTDLKSIFLLKLKNEKDWDAQNTLCNMVSELAVDLLPKQDWPELFSFMLMGLNSDSRTVRVSVLLLFDELIPRITHMWVPYVDRLSERFLLLMKEGWERVVGSVAVVGASVKLILYLGSPSGCDKYKELVTFMRYTLFSAVNEGQEGYAQKVLEEFIVLAGTGIEFLMFDLENFLDDMMMIVEDKDLKEETRHLGIECVLTVAENRERGCAVMQKMREFVTRLLGVLMEMLMVIEDDEEWYKANSDDQNVGESSMCSYAMESLSRVAIALRGIAVMSNFTVLPALLGDSDWRKRYAAVTAIGLTSEGCSTIMIQNLGGMVNAVMSLISDNHARVRWAAIHTIGKFSKDLSPQLQEQFHQQVLRALITAMDDFKSPRVQAHATSAMLLFSHNCPSNILKPYLEEIVCKLLEFLQTERRMLKEGALTALASLANSSKEYFQEYYEIVMPYLKVILITATDEINRLLLAKSMECITMIGMAVGKEKFGNDVKEVVKLLISLQESPMDSDDPMRSHLLQAWGRLCKCLGKEFLPYLSVSMPHLLKSAELKNYLIYSTDPDGTDDLDYGRFGVRTNVMEEKVLACNILCCCASELKGNLHLWLNELANTLVPLLKFKLHEEVKMAAISAMPLILSSATSAVKKGLPLPGLNVFPVKSLSDMILPSLLEALHEDSKAEIRTSILDSLYQCLQIPGCHLKKTQLTQFVEWIAEVLTACSNKKRERRERVKPEDMDAGQHELVKEETEQEEKLFKMIGDILGTLIKTFKTDLLPSIEKLLPFIAFMWANDKTANERRIALRIFRDVAEQCQEEAFRYYQTCIPFLIEACRDENPEVRQVVACGIGICAEFGGSTFKTHVGEALFNLKSIIEHHHALCPENVMAYEAAVSAYGRICHLHYNGIMSFEVTSVWLNHLPLRNDIHEAKVVHDMLCSMIETAEYKLCGPEGLNVGKIFGVLSEVLWSSCLATPQTANRMIKILKQYQKKLPPSNLAIICSSLPIPVQTMLQAILSS